MKLLVVSQYYWPEPFRITDIAEELVRRGHEVDVLTSVPNVPQGSFYPGYGWFSRGEKTRNGVNIERVGVVQRKKGGAVRLALNCASYAIDSLFHLPKLRKRGYDAVFVFNNSPVTKILPAKRIAKKERIPNIVFLLDIWPQSMFLLLGMKESDDKTLFRKIAYKVSRWFYKSVDLMLISSKGFEPKLREMGIDCDVAYFPNYAERYPETGFSLSRAERGIPEDAFLLGFSGNIGVAQGLGLTVEATKKANNPKLHWLIVGDGPELEPLKAAVAAAGLSSQYTFTGWVDGEQLPAYLHLCDALFLPLKDQEVLNLTVPAKLQTYMSAAKPVLAFMNGAGAETVIESGCGIVAAAEDTDALARALAEMGQLPQAERARMGESGKVYCDIHFDRNRQIDNLVKYIEGAIVKYKGERDDKTGNT